MNGYTYELPERVRLRNERRTCFYLMVRWHSRYWLNRWLNACRKVGNDGR